MSKERARLQVAVCNRTACDRELIGGYIAIHNSGSIQPRYYCMECGRSIMDFNPALNGEVRHTTLMSAKITTNNDHSDSNS